MSKYIAPIREIVFGLDEIVQLPEILSFKQTAKKSAPKFDVAWFDQAQRFATEFLLPLSTPENQEESIDHSGQVVCPPGFERAFQEFYRQGWMHPLHQNNITQPICWSLQVALHEIWNAACPSLAAVFINSLTCFNTIQEYAAQELQQAFLPRLLHGHLTASLALTEEQAGSDIRAIKTKAWPVGQHFRLSGHKQWVSYGQHSLTEEKIYLTLARLQGSPISGEQLSLFIVPQLTGIEHNPDLLNDILCQSLEKKFAFPGCPIANINFGTSQGAVAFAVGNQQKGLGYIEDLLQIQRLMICAQNLGICERTYQESVFYARNRIQGQTTKNSGSSPIIMHPDIRRLLMTMRTLIQAMRHGVYFTAGALDRARNHFDTQEQQRYLGLFTLLLPILKTWSSQYSVHLTTLATHIHGAAGNRSDSIILQNIHNTLASFSHGGTSGMLCQHVIQQELIDKNGISVRVFLDGMRETIPTLTRELGEEGTSIRFSLEASIDALEETTDWILENYRQHTARILAGSVPYVHLFGTVYLGWLLTEAVISSKRLFNMAKIDPATYQNKLLTAKFYADAILPQAEQDAITVMGGCSTILEMPIVSL